MKVACVLLAAGSSRRMEGANKLLLEVGGESVVKRVARAVSNAQFSEVVAVTGHNFEEVQGKLGPNLRTVHNPDFAVGMHASIRAGLQALESTPDVVAICLGDQPTLKTADYDLLIKQAHAGGIVVPVYQGQRGNPCLIARRFFAEILEEPDRDQGCRYLFDRHPEAVSLFEMPDAAALFDVDTRAAFAQYQQELAWK